MHPLHRLEWTRTMQEQLTLTITGHTLPHASPQSVSPPPYEPNTNSSVFLAETTTTRTEVVTTTTTTTHFFSLSPWRKSSFANLMHQSAGINDNGQREPIAFPTRPRVEKELPPTPPHDQDLDSNISPTYASADLPKSPEVRDSQPTRHSTAVLARAALGLGLPPHASTSSSSSRIPFGTASSPGPEDDVTTPEVYKSDQINANLTHESLATVNDEDRRRRTRGVSFGASSFLKLGSAEVKGKRKEKEIGNESAAKGSPKTISRRPSFWSRKKSDTVVRSSTTSDNTEAHLAPHLTLPPISPFDANITFTPSPFSSLQHYRTISRSYSERGDSCQTTEATSSRRPATANPSDGHLGSRFPMLEPSSAPEVLPVFMRSSRRPQTAVTGQRPRSLTNPPGLFLSPLDQSISLKPPLPRGSSASSTGTRNRPNSTTYSLDKGLTTILPSGDSKKPQLIPPVPLKDQESPELYLSRLQAAVSKVEVAGILASNADAFHVQALRTYIGQFNFVNDPLDVALRRLLMEVGLPRETQQIDRVVEAFAGRYVQCNPNLFTSEDHPYILAFSLIMLHTDAFNKSNKHKMTRAAYVKNARLPGVASDVLHCFYDNIVFAPFVFIEDPVDVNGQRGVSSEAISSRPSTRASNSGPVALMRGNKIDPYYLIANNLLDPLRLNVDNYVPMENPYSYEGTAGPWDEAQLRLAFAKPGEMEVGSPDHGSMLPFFGLGMGGSPPSPFGSSGTSPESYLCSSEVWTLKVTKVGLLNRKDDILEGGKKASNRKWKLWSVVLTGSQLLFFRDSTWSTSMLAQTVPSDGHVIFPQQAVFKPDEVLSVKDAVAVIDKSYLKYEHTLRFVLPDGRQSLLQAPGRNELNEWISRINYASAFKSAGVRMRPLDMSGIDVKLTGIAAAASHLRSLQHHEQAKARGWDSAVPDPLVNISPSGSEKEQRSLSVSNQTLLDGPEPFMSPGDTREDKSPSVSNPTLLNGVDNVDLDVPVAPEIDGANQFQATFDQVKADLAMACSTDETPTSSRVSESPESAQGEVSRLPARSEIMQAKIQDLESRIAAASAHLDADMRFVRNVATLTPFQKSTRDRLVIALQAVSKRVAQVRLDITRLTCHRDVLSNDLASEGRSWRRAKTIALQAAQETLQHRYPGNPPKLTVPPHRETFRIDSSTAQSSPHYLDTPLSCRPESSLCESFHSALDFGPPWLSAENLVSPESAITPPLVDSPKLSSSLSFAHMDVKSATSSPRRSSTVLSTDRSSRTSGESEDHERLYSAYKSPREQAEAWNQTRCAQRVSLVRMPSYIQMPISRKHNDQT